MASMYVKSFASCHLLSWSSQAKVNEKWFLLKAFEDVNGFNKTVMV